MMWFLRFPVLFRVVIALCLGVMLSAVGSAHRPVERPAQMAALAAFVAAGGSLADLCHDAGDGHGSGHAAMDCPACTLSGSVVLPVNAEVALPVPVLAQRGFWPAQVAAFVASSPTPTPPARGPPAVTTA